MKSIETGKSTGSFHFRFYIGDVPKPVHSCSDTDSRKILNIILKILGHRANGTILLNPI